MGVSGVFVWCDGNCELQIMQTGSLAAGRKVGAFRILSSRCASSAALRATSARRSSSVNPDISCPRELLAQCLKSETLPTSAAGAVLT